MAIRLAFESAVLYTMTSAMSHPRNRLPATWPPIVYVVEVEASEIAHHWCHVASAMIGVRTPLTWKVPANAKSFPSVEPSPLWPRHRLVESGLLSRRTFRESLL